ncbi:hypothetical protein KVR01_009520 [Diaporthe batatas]|uniref:uncharacterized protein n=1 Tax=Diaporthe batatas TaxID=748121 RepID=UPI001D05475A|nr:uncharacterized protein KVR01_009520 [Diaporthe batatas]KAG8161256.1 hypothetical protein KVR01_009520 [Diaporthe batatas]
MQAQREAALPPMYKFGDMDLKPGTCVELREPFGNWKAQFVDIGSIWVSKSDGSVIIRGLGYTRNRNLRGMLKKRLNEVSQVLETEFHDQRPANVQCQIEFSPKDILRLRTLVKTNAMWDVYNYVNYRRWRNKTVQERETKAPLVCRGKFCVQYRDARARRDNKPSHDRAYIRLREAEADEGKRESDKALRFNWRGKTQRGGSHKPSASGQDQRFTFGDTFCGAGGVSRGAVMAGFKLVFGVDNCPAACATYRRNFPGAHTFEQHITDWINDAAIHWTTHPIDILHLSPPCQPFSPQSYSHASAGRVNELAQDAFTACEKIIDKCRQRLLTLEETFGITHDTHEGFMNNLVQGLTELGYSVRWKVVPLVEYGLPQTRKRFIMIGSCPGEPLPPWPPATHARTPTGSQKPFVTEAQAIRGLSRRDPLHDVARATLRNDQPRDGNAPLPKTITCGGVQGVSHFSGLRDYTLREIACLQGFPVSHQFEGNKTQIRKQIGNAFPSCAVKEIYDHLRAWLEKVDGVQRAPPTHAEAPRVPAPRRAGPPVVRPRDLPSEANVRINGDLTEEEALELALQESRSESLPAAFIVPSVEEDRQDTPVSDEVGPLLERMSIAPLTQGEGSPDDNILRRRSHTLGRSATPGPSHHAESAPQKRSLDSMHDGDADEVMKEQSPPKRERFAGTGNSNDGGVDDRKIPSRLPRYLRPQRPCDVEVDNVAVGQRGSGSHDDQLDWDSWTL